MSTVDMSGSGGPVLQAEEPSRPPSGLLTDAYALFTNAGSTALLGLVYWIAAARLYDTSSYGVAVAVISGAHVLSLWGLINLPQTVLRFLPTAGGVARRSLMYAYALGFTCTCVLATVFVIAGAAGGLGESGRAVGSSPLVAAAFVVAAGVWAIFFLQDISMVAAGGSKWVPPENILFGIAKLVLLVLLRDHGTAGLVISWFLPAVLATIPVNAFLFGSLLKRVPPQAVAPGASYNQVRQFLVRGLPGYLATSFVSAAIPLVVAVLVDEQETAYFAAAWSMGAVADFAVTGFAQALLVAGARRPDEQRKLVRDTARHLAPIIVLAAAGLMLLGPVVLRIYGGDFAREGAIVLQLFAVGLVFRAARAICVSLALLNNAVWRATVSDVITAGLLLVTLVLLLPWIGIAGAGLSYAIANAVALGVFVRRRPRLRVTARSKSAAGRNDRTPLAVIDQELMSSRHVNNDEIHHVTIAVAVLTVALSLVAPGSAPAAVVVIAFALWVPGWAIVVHARSVGNVEAVVLAVTLSISMVILSAQLMSWLHWWHPRTALVMLAAASTASIASTLRRPARADQR